MASEANEATVLPDDRPSTATELPEPSETKDATVLPPPVSPAEPDRGPSPSSSPSASAAAVRDLPTRGTRKATRKAAAFLGHDVDVAYEVNAGPSPWVQFAPAPLLLVVVAVPALAGLLALLYGVSTFILHAVLPARTLAVRGPEVWLLRRKHGYSRRPTEVIADGTRGQIVFDGGQPFPSVRFGGERLWFQLHKNAARRLPAADREMVHQ